MGLRYHLDVWRHISDFSDTEQAFLIDVWNNVFEPGNGDYCATLRLREKFHGDMHLPGSERDWGCFRGQKVNGDIYFSAGFRIERSMSPPFPKCFTVSHGFSHYVPVPNIWHWIFDKNLCICDKCTWFIPLATVRQRLNYFFHADWLESYFYGHGRDMEELFELFPRTSPGWETIRDLFSFFEAKIYLEALRFLARDFGSSSLLALSFSEDVVHWNLYEAFATHNQRVQDIVDRFAHQDIDSIADILSSIESDRYGSRLRHDYFHTSDLVKWMIVSQTDCGAHEFVGHFATNEEEYFSISMGELFWS